MRAFSYARARSVDDVLAGARDGDVTLLAGGTELLNWARIGIERPHRVLDISAIPGLDAIEPLEDGGLRIGAVAKLNQVAMHADVRSRYPVLAQAIVKSASAQLRNLATIGGNPVQSTRCVYADPKGGLLFGSAQLATQVVCGYGGEALDEPAAAGGIAGQADLVGRDVADVARYG